MWNKSNTLCKPIYMATYEKPKIVNDEDKSFLNELSIQEQIELFADLIVDQLLKDMYENAED